MSDPYALAVNVVEKATGAVVHQMHFFPSSTRMAGLVESFERAYVGTEWRTVRKWLMNDAEIDAWLDRQAAPEPTDSEEQQR